MTRPIGSSSVGAVFGLSPYTTPAEVAERLRGGRSRPAGAAALLGNLLEPGLREDYARRIDREIHPGPPYGAEPWPVVEHQISHPDGWYAADGGARLHEIKSLSSWDGWDDEGPGAMPRHDYALQGIHQLEARHPSGLELVGVDFYAFNVETGERRVYRIERTARGARLVAKLGDWYERHVVEGEPVEVTAPAVYVPRTAKPPVYATHADARAAVLAYVAAGRAVAESEALRDAARAALLALVGDADGLDEPLLDEGGNPVLDKKGKPRRTPLATYHRQESRRVSPDRLRELQAERPDLAPILDRLWTVSESRSLLTKVKE